MKMLLINLVLAAVLAFFTLQTYQVWFGTESVAGLPHGAKCLKSVRPRMPKGIAPKKMPRESAYREVVNLNLYSPDRRTPLVEKPEKVKKPEIKDVKISGKKIMLYGVISSEHYRAALINNPLRKGKDRKNKWVKINETIGQLRVKDIQPERLILADGADLFEISLYDKDKPKRKEIRENKQKPKVVVAKSKTGPPKPSLSSKGKSDDNEYEIIDTPFGKVKRRKK